MVLPVFAFLFRLSLCMCCLFGLSASVFSFLPLPLLCHLPCPTPSAALSCPTPAPCHFSCIFLFCPIDFIFFQVLFPSLHPPTPSCYKREKKKGGGIKTQKSPNTTNLECVAKCCVLLVASVCPCGLQPARPPYPSAVCPARLPALPFLPTTRSSVPGCLVMVPDV